MGSEMCIRDSLRNVACHGAEDDRVRCEAPNLIVTGLSKLNGQTFCVMTLIRLY